MVWTEVPYAKVNIKKVMYYVCMLRIYINSMTFYLDCKSLNFLCSAEISEFLDSFSEFSKIFRLGSDFISEPGANNTEAIIIIDARE